MESRRLLGRMSLEEGVRRADAGEAVEALAWFARQRELVPEDADAMRDRDWFAVAFHLRVLLREFAFADVELVILLRQAEARL